VSSLGVLVLVDQDIGRMNLQTSHGRVADLLDFVLAALEIHPGEEGLVPELPYLDVKSDLQVEE
jgi:hypothetical protein